MPHDQPRERPFPAHQAWLRGLGARWALIGLAAALLLITAAPTQAAEQIESFASRIEIRADGSMNVTETIIVTAEGKKIRRGIYRDLPVIYAGPWFTQVEVPLEIRQVLRDGQPEPYHLEAEGRYRRIYIGQEDAPLTPDRYTYTLVYQTSHVLGFFADHDELYWNVTGNEWDFPVLEASAEVILPARPPDDAVSHEAYTGPEGAQGGDYKSWIDPQTGHVHFASTAAFKAGEGMTIVTTFPKGIVTPPSQAALRTLFWASNRPLIVGLVGLGVIVLYYLAVWMAVGRDPPRGMLPAQLEPPRGLSPAAVRYIWKMGFDDRVYSAAVLSLAVKGAAELHQDEEGVFKLRRLTKDRAGLSSGEKAMAAHLLKHDTFTFQAGNRRSIQAGEKALERYLKLEYEGSLFQVNRSWLIPGLVLSAATLVVAALTAPGERKTMGIFVTFWLSLWTIGVVALLRQAVWGWRQVFSSGGVVSLGAAIGSTLFAIPFIAGELVGLGILAAALGLAMVPVLVVILGVNVLFLHLLKRPTAMGRTILDQIEGFRAYLLSRPDTVPAWRGDTTHYEKFLPYAVALDAEREWSEQLDEVIHAARTQGEGDHVRRPTWYHSNHPSHSWNMSALGEVLSGAIGSASSPPPGSRSGSGGGGSSGGGGGGGGGGGW